MGRCAGAAVGISVKPLDKRVGAHPSASHKRLRIGRAHVSDTPTGIHVPRAQSDAASLTPSLLLLGWRR